MTTSRPVLHALSVAILIALPALVAAQEPQPTTQEAQPAAQEPQPAPQPTQEATTAAQPPSEEEATTLDTLVVTGSATGGVKKLEASYNIVVAGEEQIKQSNPKSTADLLKISPGMWPESTGGQTGANIEIAGFPGGGDAPYFSTLLMGSPLYGMPTLSFFETTTIFRLDDTIESVEILQGGPSVVFADAQIGATANFRLKTGTEEPSGSVGLTYGDEGLWRIDAFSGFPVGKSGWYGSIGGFWRTSNGVRDPEFPADEGGQLTATLARDFDAGNLTLYARYLDDKNQFITPIPVRQTGTDTFEAAPGFDPLTSTYNSEAIRHVTLPGYPGGGVDADLADGRGAKFFFFGGNFDYEFDNGWSISDKFLFDEGVADTNALFSGNNPSSLSDFLFADIGGGVQIPENSQVTANYVGGGAVPMDQSVIGQGWWHIHKRLKSFNNDLRLSKELFEGNTLTIGFYVNRYYMDDKWALGNRMLMTNEPNATPITVSYTPPGPGASELQLTDAQGLLDYGTFNIAQSGSATNTALYLSDSWRIGKWLLDLSGRIENQDATNTVCNLTTTSIDPEDPDAVDLDGDPNTLYDNSVSLCDGTSTRFHYDKTHPSWTAGANYSFTDHMSAYVRANTGGHFLDFDNGIRGANDGFPPMQKIRNYETGFKYQSDLLYADISAYRRKFKGLLFQPTDGAGTPVGSPLAYGSDSWGINFIGALTPTDSLRLELVANYLDGEYTDFDACFPYRDINDVPQCQPIEGQQLQRQPKLRYRFTPSYQFIFGWGDITPYITYTHVGDHTQDQSGLQELGSYETWDFGVTANVGEHWQVNVRGTNMTDELGLTESNSRIFGSALTPDGIILARPLEGREVNAQVKYTW